MRSKIIIVLLAVALALGMVVCIQHGSLTTERAKSERLTQNIRTLTEEAKVRFVRDSLRASEAWALVLQVDELEKQRAKDAQLIKDMKIRLKDARTVTTIETIVRDTVFFHVSEDTQEAKEDILCYHDPWADISFMPADSSLSYSFRDSVTSVLHIHYRKKFLWWRWKPVYKVTLVNHNPRCRSITGEVAVVRDD